MFLDIEDIYQKSRGRKVVNAFMASSATMFRTARGRMAMSVKLETFDKLRRQLRISLEDGHDGLKVVLIDESPAVASAA